MLFHTLKLYHSIKFKQNKNRSESIYHLFFPFSPEKSLIYDSVAFPACCIAISLTALRVCLPEELSKAFSAIVCT